MFIGFFSLESTLSFLFQSKNTSGVPTAADSAPTFRIYDSSGLKTNGTGTTSAFDSGNVTGVYLGQKTLAAADGYARGGIYFVRVACAVSSNNRADIFTFGVV